MAQELIDYLGLLGDVDDLLEAGHTQGYVLGGDTGKMEGVQGHLSGRLADGLGGHGANHLPGRRHGQLELGLDLTQQPLEGLQQMNQVKWRNFSIVFRQTKIFQNCQVQPTSSVSLCCSATFLVQKVSLTKLWKSMVAFSLA